jgi:hypothetical protein
MLFGKNFLEREKTPSFSVQTHAAAEKPLLKTPLASSF